MASSPLVLETDDLEVVLLPEHGARLHRIRAFGHDLLRTPADPALHATDPFFWGAYVLAPWCNRLPPGPTRVAGRTVNLAPNFADGTAIHGQVYARAWQEAGEGWLRATGGGDGWPWPYEVRLRPLVDGSALSLDLRLINRSDGPMPAGLGLHPWFVRPVEVGVPAQAVYPSNSGSSVRPQPADGTSYDMRSMSEPPAELDATWTGLSRPAVQLRWPDIGIEAELEIQTDASPCVAVATPSDPAATAVEPQTHAPDGLRRLINGEPDAIAVLAPDETLRLGLRLQLRRR
jgi:aldose 1-epimerase